MSHDRTFFGEALNVFGFFFQEAKWDQKREIGIYVACIFEHAIKDGLHVFPNSVAPRFNHHATTNWRVFRHVSGGDDLLVPLWIVF
ncbi:hypothetical protein D3C87_1613640 [compost metagenome]